MKHLFQLCLIFSTVFYSCAPDKPITTMGEPAILEITSVSDNAVRVTLRPESMTDRFMENPALSDKEYSEPVLALTALSGKEEVSSGNLRISVTNDPELQVEVRNLENEVVQSLLFVNDTILEFNNGNSPVLGMGEGGPRPGRGVEWRELPVEYDRRGRYHNMQPRWQSNAYGSRNPVPLLLGTEGWALFSGSPWVEVDLQGDKGKFIGWFPEPDEIDPQNQRDQQQNRGKGLPPPESVVPGLWDIFVFDASDPSVTMRDIADISGHSVIPPKWALGYMQSHRTLDDENQLIGIVDSFREKEIPVDAVIYLGTGFCPQGWNETQPSFEFNENVFLRDPKEVIDDLHDRNVKVVVHMVPWDRDELPTLHGTIPPKPGEELDESHIKNYWEQHVDLVNTGIDAWWPDEGDWFNLHERIKRHQLYYQGPLSTTPDVRPWSLHRNGYLGVGKWGGWVWSGDTQSAWKTLEAQIAVGINHSLSLSPYWGSDIGGFYPNPDKTGEMYARWFQFGAFVPSFRSHGRTWFTALPWGFGLSDMGPREPNNRNDTTVEGAELRSPSPESMNDLTLEPVTRKYAQLRYRLLPYIYSMSWEAYNSGMPLMRALWLHYPEDEKARGIGDEYLWGRDMLIAPIYIEGAENRSVYLPEGTWYDWWNNETHQGGAEIVKEVDLETMPIYVRAGGIIPMDPLRQYTAQEVDEPTVIRVYTGADGEFIFYEDDGVSQQYLDGKYSLTQFNWDDANRTLNISSLQNGMNNEERKFVIELLPEGTRSEINYGYNNTSIEF